MCAHFAQENPGTGRQQAEKISNPDYRALPNKVQMAFGYFL